MSKKWLISVMATAMVFTLGLGAGCFNSGSNPSSSSDPIQSSSSKTDENEATLSLDKRTASVSEYETVKLTATAANGEGDVAWTSSDDKIATVDANGVVTGVKAGTATITASYSGLSVTCTVTVVKAQTPVMNISAENVSLNKDEAKSVTVSTTVKDKEVAGVQYNWYLEDSDKETSNIASIEVSADTKTATFTGIGEGTETYIVYANVHGEDLYKEVTITVVDTNVTFSVANMNNGAEAYEAELSLATGDNLIQSIKPEISVYYKQNKQDDVALEFTNSNSEVATMAEDGTITALKEGVATFTANVSIQGSSATLVLRINVTRAVFKIADVTLEMAKEDKTLALGEDVTIQGTVNKVTLEGADVLASFDNNVITFDAEKLPYKTADLGEGKSLVIETEKAKYVANADVYTLVLKTKEDLGLIRKTSYAAEDSVLRWGGYYVLGNDIDMENTGVGGPFTYAEIEKKATDNSISFGNDSEYGTSARDGRANGFFGVFDGKGHTIDNFVTSYWSGGLFTIVGAGGVVKNVSFTNTTLLSRSPVIADCIAGTVENVYINVKEAKGPESNPTERTDLYVLNKSDSWATTRINNCIVVLPETGTEDVGVAKLHKGYGVVNGLYVIGANAGISWLSTNSNGESDTYALCDSYVELSQAADFSGWSKDFWTLHNGVAFPKNVDTSAWGDKTHEVDATALSIGSTIEVKGRNIRIALSEEALNLGITMDGNSFIVPDNADLVGNIFSVDVINFFNDGEMTSITFAIVGTTTIDVETAQDVDLNNAATQIDLSSVEEQITGGFVSATFNGKNVTSNVSYAENTLTADLSNINAYGAQTLTLTFHVTNEEGTVTAIQKVNVPVNAYRVITTKAQLLAMDSYMIINGKDAYADIRLGADIDAEGARVGIGTWQDGYGWTRIFTGTFDGKQYTISNTTQAQNQGLFACIGETGVVKNVYFKNATIASNGGFVVTQNDGTVQNVFVQGKITNGTGHNWSPTSLLVGKNLITGKVQDCVVVLESSTLNASHGGILAGYSQGSLTNCIAINLSGKQVFAVGTQGKTDADVPTEEKAGDANTVVTSLKDYYDVKADLSYGAWAEDLIAAVVNDMKGVMVGKTELSLGETAQIVEKTSGVVQGYALKAAVTGVSVDENGLVSVAEDAAPYVNFTVVVTFVDGTTTEIEMKTAPVPEVKNIASLGDVDASKVTTVSHDFSDVAAGMTIKHVYANGNEAAFTNDGLNVSVNLSGLNLGNNDLQFIFESDSARVLVNTTVLKASIIVSDADEFMQLNTIFAQGENATGYDAYVILDADIDMTGTPSWQTYWNWGDKNQKGWSVKTNGFFGTFDGRGHYVANLTMGHSSGLFGILHTSSVVKNVAFVNVTLPDKTSLFASMADGTLENVYVHVKQANYGNSPNGWGVLNPNIGTTNQTSLLMKNVYVQVDGISDTHKDSQAGFGSIIGVYNGENVYDNVLVVSNGATVYVTNVEQSPYAAGKLQAYDTRAAMKAADDWSITSWSTDIWATDADGLPMFKSLKNGYFAPVITNSNKDVGAGSTYQVYVTCGSAVTYSVDNADCSIDANGLLTIGETIANGTKVTVTVTGVLSGNTATLELTVANVKKVTIEDTADVDVTKETSIALGDANLTSITSVSVNGVANEALTLRDGKLVVPAGTFGTSKTDWGEMSITVAGIDNANAITTVDLKIFAYVGITHVNLLNNTLGYREGRNVYGEFRLLNDVDATGWAGNGTWNSGWELNFYGTLDGCGHVVSNYSAGTNYGIMSMNYGTVKNLIVRNSTVTGNGGIICMGNQGVVENIVVEGKLNGAGNKDGTPAAMLVAKNEKATGIIRNCVVVYVDGVVTDNCCQGLFTAYNADGSTVENCVAIKLVNKAVFGVGEKKVHSQASEQMSATNTIFDSVEAYIAGKDGITTDDWATEYLNDIFKSYLTISGPAVLVKNGSAQYTVANQAGGCTWALTEEIEGVSISNDGVLTIGADATAETVTIQVTNLLGQSKTFEVSIVANTEKSTFTAFEYNASKGDAKVTVSGVSSKELTLLGVTVGGSNVTATLADGVVTIPSKSLTAGPTANSVVIMLSDGDKVYEYSGEITKITYVINTADDFVKLGTAFANNTIVANKSYGGYFVLNSDIDMTGKTFNVYWNWTSIRNDAGGWNTVTGGFIGTFDGRGHTVSNLKINGNNGIFGIINTDSVVKNVAFENATLGYQQALFASIASGTVSNVYASIVVASNGAHPNGLGLANVNGSQGQASITWKNVFVNVLESKTTDKTQYTNIFGAAKKGGTDLNDCYAITQDVNLYWALGEGDTYETMNKAKGWTTMDDMKADTSINWTEKVAAWNEDAGIEFWTVKDGVPMAKSTADLNA